MRLKILLGVALLGSSCSYADIPTPLSYILLGSVNANDGVEIECNLLGNSNTRIRCNFVQIHINKKISPNELQKKNKQDLSAALVELDKEGYQKRINEGMCSLLASEELSAGELSREVVEFKYLLTSYCPVSSKQQATAFLGELVQNSNNTAAKTCNIFLNKWTHDFEYQFSGNQWVSTSQPNGSCGIIHVSTLRPEKEYSSLWNYTTQKIVTNKSGESIGLNCSEWDESIQEYSWKYQPKELSCDFIKYGMF